MHIAYLVQIIEIICISQHFFHISLYNRGDLFHVPPVGEIHWVGMEWQTFTIMPPTSTPIELPTTVHLPGSIFAGVSSVFEDGAFN